MNIKSEFYMFPSTTTSKINEQLGSSSSQSNNKRKLTDEKNINDDHRKKIALTRTFTSLDLSKIDDQNVDNSALKLDDNSAMELERKDSMPSLSPLTPDM